MVRVWIIWYVFVFKNEFICGISVCVYKKVNKFVFVELFIYFVSILRVWFNVGFIVYKFSILWIGIIVMVFMMYNVIFVDVFFVLFKYFKFVV